MAWSGTDITAMSLLKVELNQLPGSGHALAVTPFQHTVGQTQGGKCTLAAPNAIKAMAAKLQDGADPHLPVGPLHAVVWLVTIPASRNWPPSWRRCARRAAAA